jgi:hypothetical protein
MGYFFSGYQTNISPIKDIENSFMDVVPSEIKKDVQSIKESKSFLMTYGVSKVISDVMIHDRKTGSWLAILGTPLINLSTEAQKMALLDRFFCSPMRTIKEELDGCFAVLSHNAPENTFYAITDYDNTTPIFYSATSSGIYFSSHELPLARFLHSQIDPLGFSMTIHLRLTWGSQTRFKGISKLVPCQIMTFRKLDRYSSEIYWKPSDETQWPSIFNDVIGKWLSLLKDSVQAFYNFSKNKTVICDFTAGEDARLLLSQCHAAKIPFLAMVDGLDNDLDVQVSKEASRKTGFDLVIRPKNLITEEKLLANATYISLMNDAYEDYFGSCTAYMINLAYPLTNYEYVKFCGGPGGEVFRGSYYLRGKALFPSSRGHFDYRFFTRMKYLLDFHPGLLRYSDEEFKHTIFALIEKSLEDVVKFPIGIKIDHLLRVFQTCNDGLIYKNPRYLPFATKHMTHSIYNIPPHFKRGGKLTKACTEILYPELAIIKTQKGVPTIRKTLPRTFLFLPEYISVTKSIMNGALSRLLKWTESNKPDYKWTRHAPVIKMLLSTPPYGDWFSSSKSMITGHLYNSGVIDSLLEEARGGSSRYVPILGRIINQELACRWVYRER